MRGQDSAVWDISETLSVLAFAVSSVFRGMSFYFIFLFNFLFFICLFLHSIKCSLASVSCVSPPIPPSKALMVRLSASRLALLD